MLFAFLIWTISCVAFVGFVFCNIALGICQLAQAVKRDIDVLLNGVADKNTVEEVKHILEMVLLLSKSIMFLTNLE